ncbi:hypothetical protein QFC21_006551 [Naganishia friedmannii]|uniref:Uncharacterized protein n=1 Tax=Naganishia friedmannii TaxID=89922 RepID=A0ACC2V1U9_9TREE|nr:hypothetical protein QFC21_006551 [Naganishia friedmannii]
MRRILTKKLAPLTSPQAVSPRHTETATGNQLPQGNGTKSTSSQAFPAGIDPSKGFHTYSIAWYPTSSGSNTPRRTEIHLDGNTLNSPQYFPSVNPSVLIFNHWTNADWRWSAGPPVKDAYMTIQRVVAYYDKPAK